MNRIYTIIFHAIPVYLYKVLNSSVRFVIIESNIYRYVFVSVFIAPSIRRVSFTIPKTVHQMKPIFLQNLNRQRDTFCFVEIARCISLMHTC